MKYYFLSSHDQPHFNWIFFNHFINKPLALKERYKQFQCSSCQKFDEKKALDSGLDDDLIIKSRSDYFLTNDGLVCISLRLKNIIMENNITGLDFISIPSNKDYYIALPNLFAETDALKAKMQFVKPQCPECGRFKEVLVIPWIEALIPPKDNMTIFSSNIWLENQRNRIAWLFTSESVVKIFKVHKIRGLNYLNA